MYKHCLNINEINISRTIGKQNLKKPLKIIFSY